jgi:hypothetical protein
MRGNIMNFSLYSDFNGDVLSKVIRGKPDLTEEKPDTTLSKNIEEVLPQDFNNKGNIDPETHTVQNFALIIVKTCLSLQYITIHNCNKNIDILLGAYEIFPEYLHHSKTM